MKLTVLGTSAAYPGPQTPCSGYLIQEGGRNILLDCGTGVLANLQSCLDLRDVSDIVITHMHADHFLDLVPYRYALRFGLDGSRGASPTLHLPPGGIDILDRVAAPFAESSGFFSEVFNLTEFSPDIPMSIGPLTVSSTPVRHYIPTYAMSFQGTGRFAYSSDSGICLELAGVARDADLFLCTVGRCLGPDISHLWGHMLPEEAGRLARESGVRQLMITHMWPACDRASSIRLASEAFGKDVRAAEILRTYDI